MRCAADIQSLITVLYPEIVSHRSGDSELSLPSLYFLDRMILSTKNSDVNEINSQVLTYFPGQATTFINADSVTESEFDYVPAEMLHTLEPSGFPQHELTVKVGAPLLLLRNLDPSLGLYNGTRMVVVNFTSHILECRVLSRNGQRVSDDQSTVFIPRMSLDASKEDIVIPLRRR